MSRLELDARASAQLDELLGSCISCGFCLPACPTFQLTGEESESPRGRIELVAALQADELALDDVRPHLDRCLGCRACEPACPSNVQYGQILELARGGGCAPGAPSPRWRRARSARWAGRPTGLARSAGSAVAPVRPAPASCAAA
jgi:glycolate oxidase iron-sulfur subunit